MRSLSLSPRAAGALRSYGTIVNIFAGAYLGGLVVCFTSLYFLYKDADQRQHIPFSISFNDQILAVKAIGKDDVLKSPRHAVKHYRRLLLNMAKAEQPDLHFDETLPDGSRNYAVPILPAEVLIRGKNAELANFYIDMLLRYSRALLAKGELDVSVWILKSVIDDDDIFYRLGDAERMAQCGRVLSKVTPDPNERISYLQRSIHMLQSTFRNILLDEQYLLQDHSSITDELILSLNALAFSYASDATSSPRKQKNALLTQALNIYLANLKAVSRISEGLALGQFSQSSFPLFNCEPENIQATEAEMKAHIAEILWAKGYKKKSVAWAEEVVQDTFYDKGNNARVSPILINTLDNLITMYGKLKDTPARERCESIKSEVAVFEYDDDSWYTSVIQRFTKVIYYRGPLGIIEKVLKERFGPAQPLPELEEFEDEDEE
ncbi:hypothetical protein JCM33374_g3774 [Metschnikowia sp. JCM 33374]|nr:hypothetical protein JCM33374_g3774 [Metschnikowia sp. JCM 33374]